MSYDLFYTPKAISQLKQLPEASVDRCEDNLLRLAESPTELSVPSASPPFPPRGQLFHFECDDLHGAEWFFTVMFRFSQDEQSLHSQCHLAGVDR